MRQLEVDSRSMSVDRKALDKCFESYCGVHNRIINLSQQVGVLLHVSGPRPAISTCALPRSSSRQSKKQDGMQVYADSEKQDKEAEMRKRLENLCRGTPHRR